jgi:hypothetical protein
MASPTTMRGEMLRERKTINNRFFLTLGEGTAGMSPYNPLQLGLGVTLRVNTNNHVNTVRMTLKRVTDGDSETPRTITVTQVSDSEWRAEGAVGGVLLGFPQPAPDYHIPQCFELTLTARNRGRSISRVYNFWVAEGPVGTIVECIDRELIGAKPLVCCFDDLSFRDPTFGWVDEFAEFFARSFDAAMECIEDEGEGLLPDPGDGVYVVGLPDPLFSIIATDNPWARTEEDSPTGLFYPYATGSPEFTVNGFDPGLIPAGSVFGFDFPTVSALLTHPISLFNDKAWVLTPREPYIGPTFTWVVSPLLDFRNFQNASMEFYVWEDIEFDGGVRVQYTQDEGNTWTDIPSGDYSVPLVFGGPPMGVFGGSNDKVVVQAQTLTRITVDLSQFDDQPVRLRWCSGFDGGVPVDAAGVVISGIRFFADAGPILQMELDMDRLRAGFGDQWKYPRPSADELWQHGTIQKAPRGAPAAVHPTLGTGIVNTLIANPQVGNDIGGIPAGPNIGYPRGVDGVRIELVSGELWGPTGSDLFVFDLVLDSWAPGMTYHILFGAAANWVPVQGGFVQLQNVQPAHLMCSINQAAAYYNATPAGAWPAAGVIGAPIVATSNTTRISLSRIGSGVIFVNGVTFAVQVIVKSAAALVPGGAGYFVQLFPISTLRSNALRLVTVV